MLDRTSGRAVLRVKFSKTKGKKRCISIMYLLWNGDRFFEKYFFEAGKEASNF